MIKLKQNEFGHLVTPYDSSFSINMAPNAPRPGISVEWIKNQNELEQLFPFFEKYNFTNFSLLIVENEAYFNFENLPKIEKLRNIDFTFLGKKCGFNILPESKQTLEGIREFKLISDYAIDFNQFTSLSNLLKLTVQHHKHSSNWMEHDDIVDLVIYKFKENDLTSLSGMKSLKRLKIEQGSLKSLGGIENLTNLKTLHIHSLRNLTDLKALLKSSSIENLIFEAYTKTIDWGFLTGMKQLRLVSLTEAKSLNFFKDLPNLIVGGAGKIHDNNKNPQNELFERFKNTELPNIQRNIAVAPYDPYEI